jgi:hypothetical protein
VQISKGIGLEALVGKSYKPGELVYIPVSIVNSNPFPLYSALENKLFLSYHIFREDNTLIAWEGLRTPLETDLYTIGYQDIMIKLPAETGVYRLVIDMILEGKGWFNLNESHLIRIR